MTTLADLAEPCLQLIVAMLAGMAIGLNRDLHHKPTGARTLGLVALGSAMVTIAATRYVAAHGSVDGVSRVLQGVVQGVLTGVGFIGAGVILHDPTRPRVQGLTTAASVWITAVLGLVCGLAEWPLLVVGLALTFLLLGFGGAFERHFRAKLDRAVPPVDHGEG